MKITKAKEIAASILNCGKRSIVIEPTKISEVKKALTRDDIRALISEGIIKKDGKPEQSLARAKKLKEKKKKGRKRGKGKRKGTKKARMKPKQQWIARIRALRRTLRELRKEKPDVINAIGYRKLYLLIKGNYFKGKKYLIRYVEEKEKELLRGASQ